jgi:hypothetical protein
MSGRPKIKSKVVKATLANKDVLDMFQGVLGTSEGSATLSITHPKYLRIQGHIDRFIRLLTVLHGSAVIALFPGPKEHLGGYVDALRKQFGASFVAPDFTPWLSPPAAAATSAGIEAYMTTTEDYAKIPPEVVAQFGEVFAAVKKCNIVNTVIVACKNLVAHKKSLGDQAALKDRFLTKGAGMTFAPLPDLPQVNFKQIYIDDRLTPSDKEFVLVVLHKMYTIGHDVYEAVSSPDVDVSEFVEVIMSSIGEVKKHIPRCDQAFQKIIESVDLLKGNFDGYYKDYTASGNPTIIMENFVLDVSKNTKTSPAVTAQFRRIIAHYRKLASQQGSHPKLQSLFAQVDANFQELEKKSKEADAKGSGGDGGDDSDDSDDDGNKKETNAEAAATAVADSGAVPEVAKAVRAEGQRGKSARNRRKKAARAAKAAAQSAQAPTGDELADELADEPADELADEPADELADEPAADELADEPADELADEPADELADEPADEPADDEPADEPADDEPADDELADDEPADEESADGLADEFDQVTVLTEDSGADLGDE